MANLLSMATIDAILALHQRHWSIVRIAKELGLHRDTVARYIHLYTQAAQAIPSVQPQPPPADAAEGKIGQASLDAAAGKIGQAPIGSDQVKTGQAPIGSEAPPTRPEQASLCEPFRRTLRPLTG